MSSNPLNHLTPEERARLRELASKATPMPWQWETGRSEVLCECGILDAEGNAVFVNSGRGSGDPSEDDRDYILAACNSVLRLLDELERRMPPLVWSKTPPTVPGKYWWRSERGEAEYVDDVEQGEIDNGFHTDAGEWAGPIPQPIEASE